MDHPDGGVTVAEATAAFTITGDDRSGHPDFRPGTVRYCTAEADTGYRYALTVTALPNKGARGEGGPLLVTVTSPWVDAWALQRTGYLSQGYVREHLCGGPGRRVSDADVAVLTLLVRHALNRGGDL